jgi:transcriptional regulator with XRE-family HTH domain
MPRPNRLRSIGDEANLARRIEWERTRRGLAYEVLAKQMTDAGCSISGSAIYKIEKGSPPRRITVDELVALAKVFETTVENLLIPIEVLEHERAQELLKKLDHADSGLLQAIGELLTTYSELFGLAAHQADLHDYVAGHHFRERAERPPLVIGGGDPEIDEKLNVDEAPLLLAYVEFCRRMLEYSDAVARARIAAAQRPVEVVS